MHGLNIQESSEAAVEIEFEKDVVDLAVSLLAERTSDLNALGITCRTKPLNRDSGSTSELTIDFLDSAGIVDVIEFHVVRHGEPVASLEEVEAWLREAIDDVLSRRGPMH